MYENRSFHLSYSFVLQGEKVVPESINRLHEIAREVEDRKQQLLGTTVEAAMVSSSNRLRALVMTQEDD